MHCSIKKRMKANNSLKSYALIEVLELPYLLKGLELTPQLELRGAG